MSFSLLYHFLLPSQLHKSQFLEKKSKFQFFLEVSPCLDWDFTSQFWVSVNMCFLSLRGFFSLEG